MCYFSYEMPVHIGFYLTKRNNGKNKYDVEKWRRARGEWSVRERKEKKAAMIINNGIRRKCSRSHGGRWQQQRQQNLTCLVCYFQISFCFQLISSAFCFCNLQANECAHAPPLHKHNQNQFFFLSLFFYYYCCYC